MPPSVRAKGALSVLSIRAGVAAGPLTPVRRRVPSGAARMARIVTGEPARRSVSWPSPALPGKRAKKRAVRRPPLLTVATVTADVAAASPEKTRET